MSDSKKLTARQKKILEALHDGCYLDFLPGQNSVYVRRRTRAYFDLILLTTRRSTIDVMCKAGWLHRGEITDLGRAAIGVKA